MYEVRLLNEGSVVTVLTLRSTPLYVGRGARNDLVILDHLVSGAHMSLWVEDGRARIEDLGSRNGTFVNEAKVQGVTDLAAGDRVRIGSTELVVDLTPGAGEVDDSWLVVEDVNARVRYPMRSDRFRIGSSVHCDVIVRGEDVNEVSVLLMSAVDLALGRDDDITELRLGETFDVGGRRFAVREADNQRAATREIVPTRYGYQLSAGVGASGPWAGVTDPETGQHHEVSAENRCVLLYLLGRQIMADRAAGVDRAQAGWCSEDDLRIGVWGREGVNRNLNVLLCRVRKELRAAGFDPWFIEKQRRRVRARLSEVRIEGAG